MQWLLKRDATQAYQTYSGLLGEEVGLARELANEPSSQLVYAVVLESRFTQPSSFLALRMDAHAQYEIRVFADAISSLVKDWVPHVWELFKTIELDSFFSRQNWKSCRLGFKVSATSQT